jgi:hypothetical protein
LLFSKAANVSADIRIFTFRFYPISLRRFASPRQSAWKELGSDHARFSDYNHTRDLHSFSDATQQIYLGLKPFHQWRREVWEARSARQKKNVKA